MPINAATESQMTVSYKIRNSPWKSDACTTSVYDNSAILVPLTTETLNGETELKIKIVGPDDITATKSSPMRRIVTLQLYDSTFSAGPSYPFYQEHFFAVFVYCSTESISLESTGASNIYYTLRHAK